MPMIDAACCTRSTASCRGDAQALALHRAVDREPSENCDGNRFRHVGSDAVWRFGVGERSGGQSVVSCDGVVFGGDDIGAGRAGELVDERAPAQPVIERAAVRRTGACKAMFQAFQGLGARMSRSWPSPEGARSRTVRNCAYVSAST